MSGSKMALSGLRSVKRDWSTSSKTDSEDSQKALDARAQRLRDIQAGLDRREQTSLSSVLLQKYVNVTTADITSGSKRPPSAPAHEPAAKKRVLPPSWEKDVYTSSSNFTTAVRKSSTTGSVGRTKPGVSAAVSAQPPPVFLSQEQTQILQLVELGDSLFYTGSAGESTSSLCIYAFNIQPYRYWKVCSSTRDNLRPPEEVCEESRCGSNHRFHRCAHIPLPLTD